ncbi:MULTISPECIES: histidine triad nucleotide-binding protein [Pseudomonadaceae]|uniref:histidine triad nucleotide-binding protein n=1 Tax=Pseudomonadaceae TaxID=135621 RepID=UPI0010400B54|nr:MULTISPECIES: histidine triad nucleotide-binding protein [Pseudomonadaceae]MBA1279705.1 histidine triad nucleotide-binding protein [Stutzerimonas stutzeri]MBC8649680.1 histidine triad nucleotide-binding protein [Pseudomonas sp. MT4]QXY92035.1 histidine triad nucleotide-binding protein [Pseudomonas sp. MTM4]TCD18791.1 histidine triad nucleotide-binding protein [Pseudomonas sp. IC_126]
MDCLFCKIVAGDIPAHKLYEDDQVVAFNDIAPQAPVHFLVIPKKHIATLHDLSEDDDKALAGHILFTAQRLAEEQGCQDGFRVVMNCNDLGGQTVYHIHMHVLGQRQMHWPPG